MATSDTSSAQGMAIPLHRQTRIMETLKPLNNAIAVGVDHSLAVPLNAQNKLEKEQRSGELRPLHRAVHDSVLFSVSQQIVARLPSVDETEIGDVQYNSACKPYCKCCCSSATGENRIKRCRIDLRTVSLNMQTLLKQRKTDCCSYDQSESPRG